MQNANLGKVNVVAFTASFSLIVIKFGTLRLGEGIFTSVQIALMLSLKTVIDVHRF